VCSVTAPTAAVRDPVAHFGQGMALFDLDRTLIPGASLVHLGRELVRRKIISSGTLARYAVAQARFRHRGLPDADVDRLRGSLLGLVAGEEAAPLVSAARQVGRDLASLVPPSARWLLDRHLQAGDFCAVVSASPHELVEAVVVALGAHRAVGTRLEVVGDRCTGRLVGPFCYGAGKIACIERELGSWDLEGATAYADSASDLPLLELCGSAIAVNPDARLLAASRSRGWPVIRCR
jgi:HAD superfamily hydrolase (TIGR01490 family)